MKLNLGCGKDYKEGYVNIDNDKNRRCDVLMDLNKIPYNFSNIDEIYVSHILEHLKRPKEIIMECINILKPGGKLIIIVPHFTNAGAFTNLTHKHFFAYHSLRDFKPDKRIVFGKGLAKWNYILEPIFNKFPTLWEHTVLKNIFPAQEIRFEISKEVKQ